MIRFRKVFLLVMGLPAILSVLPQCAHAASEGPRNPSSASGLVWKNPTYTYSSDNSRASYNNSFQDILALTSFGFSSASGVIDGIKVEIEGYGTGAAPPIGDQIDVALTKDGSTPAGSWKTARALPNGLANEAYITCGGANDLWGTSWTASDIDNSNFGALIRDTDIVAGALYIDHVRVTVYYTLFINSARRIKLQKTLTGD